MVSRPFRSCSFICALDLQIILLIQIVYTMYIQAKTSCANQSDQIFLCLFFCQMKFFLTGDHLQHIFCKREIISEDNPHKYIINRPKPAQTFNIFPTFFPSPDLPFRQRHCLFRCMSNIIIHINSSKINKASPISQTAVWSHLSPKHPHRRHQKQRKHHPHKQQHRKDHLRLRLLAEDAGGLPALLERLRL